MDGVDIRELLLAFLGFLEASLDGDPRSVTLVASMATEGSLPAGEAAAIREAVERALRGEPAVVRSPRHEFRVVATILSQQADIALADLLGGFLGSEEGARLQAAVQRLERAPLALCFQE